MKVAFQIETDSNERAEELHVRAQLAAAALLDFSLLLNAMLELPKNGEIGTLMAATIASAQSLMGKEHGNMHVAIAAVSAPEIGYMHKQAVERREAAGTNIIRTPAENKEAVH